MATAVARYTAAAITDRGRKRSSNEDAFGFSVEHGVYIVCDGMGGAAAGEVASALAVDEVLRLVADRLGGLVDSRPNARLDAGVDSRTDGHSYGSLEANPDAGQEASQEVSQKAPHNGISEVLAPLPRIAHEAVLAANDAIHSRSKRNPGLSGMGTTLVGLLAGRPDEESRVWILNVGDSRCYRLRQGRIQQCTHDHSLVEEQIRMGRMTRAEAARSPFRNVITRALGTQTSVTPDVIEFEVETGDLFLLCSDGLTRELSDEKIESLLNTPAPRSGSASGQVSDETSGQKYEPASLDELCTRLVRAANKAGGHDNITCLIVRVV